MINLSSLSALIRTLRHSTGIDGPVAPIARVASVAPVADDDAGAMSATPLRASLWARTPLTPLDVPESEGAPQEAQAARIVPQPHPRAVAAAAATHSPSVPAATQSSALDLTATARILQAVLRGTGLKTPVAPTIASAMPLAPNPQVPVAELARSLANAVAESGLFYESHLARSLRREYPVASLSREPQALWPATPVAEGSIARAAPPATLPEAASAMLTRQLDLLDTRAVLWNGDVWPGQGATIAFEEGPRHDDAANDAEVLDPVASWRTRITIDLPSLGRVHATLHLHGGALDLALQASGNESLTRLETSKQALAAALADSQVAVGRLEVVPAPKG